MLKHFVVAFIVGAALVIGGAYVYPLPENPRYRSEIQVLPNGGREESFFIQLPGDRLNAPGFASVRDFPAAEFDPNGEQKITAELFRIRSADGQVVGLASRLSGYVPDLAGNPVMSSSWTISVPRRGTLSAQVRRSDEGIEAFPATDEELPPGPVEEPPPEFETREGSDGPVLLTTGEFNGLSGIIRQVVEQNEDGSPEAIRLDTWLEQRS